MARVRTCSCTSQNGPQLPILPTQEPLATLLSCAVKRIHRMHCASVFVCVWRLPSLLEIPDGDAADKRWGRVASPPPFAQWREEFVPARRTQ